MSLCLEGATVRLSDDSRGGVIPEERERKSSPLHYTPVAPRTVNTRQDVSIDLCLH